jgi:hypothetical protein
MRTELSVCLQMSTLSQQVYKNTLHNKMWKHHHFTKNVQKLPFYSDMDKPHPSKKHPDLQATEECLYY